MPSAEMFNVAGKRVDVVDLDEGLFGIEPNVPVMHQVVNAQLAAARAGTHSTKTRAEVRGGGRKPWRQKGTGRARHGSIRSPQWAGGGVAHGPKPRDYSQRTPKKMKRLALRSALSARAAAEKVKIVDEFAWEGPKTKQAKGLLESIGIDGKVLLVIDYGDDIAEKSFNNLPSARLSRPLRLTTYDVLWADTVLFSKTALDRLVAGPPTAAATATPVADDEDTAPAVTAGGEEE
ncbi:MAG: 50S ribosomal protein L4 [Acidimicrobiia bacterium]|nr:50S ribosomal protein L4 [Acidimicrobiia bacterium]MBT8214000.1 50S ribosomal protein L4 [Acidimicrobiia bacterium]NNF69065.1 50S ribosomal protein L4 [Acidimicrobiia bacterium]NNK91148.1 50S ribosomal protein L4 [Acidimicrobiia bacterium]